MKAAACLSWKCPSVALLAVNFQSPDAFGQSELAPRNSSSPTPGRLPSRGSRVPRTVSQRAWPASGAVRKEEPLSTREAIGCSQHTNASHTFGHRKRVGLV